MRIWQAEVSLAQLNAPSPTLVHHLGIEFTAIGDDYLEATMPVDARTRQPMGLLHGGASVALAETLASVAAYLTIDMRKQSVVGLEINANHVRAVREGAVIGSARPIHLGKATQVWEVKIVDANAKLACVSRVTMAVLDRAALTT
jgi:1,4-dihydroxy-2-naphthoyl-CoA hydrolase